MQKKGTKLTRGALMSNTNRDSATRGTWFQRGCWSRTMFPISLKLKLFSLVYAYAGA
jgi:hypothetical protein